MTGWRVFVGVVMAIKAVALIGQFGKPSDRYALAEVALSTGMLVWGACLLWGAA